MTANGDERKKAGQEQPVVETSVGFSIHIFLLLIELYESVAAKNGTIG